MAVKKYKPVTPSLRGMTGYTFEEITKTLPRTLAAGAAPQERRPQYVRTDYRPPSRRRHRRHIRLVDFKRDKRGIPARVAAIEYDPNRTARLALLFYVDGEKRYIIAPVDLRVGDTVWPAPA
jgi:large subunit ribosomal protein L2